MFFITSLAARTNQERIRQDCVGCAILFSLGSNILRRHDRSQAWSSNLSLDGREGQRCFDINQAINTAEWYNLAWLRSSLC